MRKTFKIVVMAITLLLLVSMSGCGYNIPSDMVAVHIKSGPASAQKVVGCKPAASRERFGNDKYALFPTNEREWDATGQKGSDSGRMQSVTKDSVQMNIPITVRFTLKTDCPDLKEFYVKYARRYGVKFDRDGTYNDAWLTVLRKLVKDPTDAALDRIVQDYNWRDVWNNPQTKTEIEKRLGEALSEDNSLLVQTAHKAYFEGITVLVGKPEPDNPDLATAVASEQTRVAQAQSAEAQAKADRAKALAEVAVAQAEAEKKRATIQGFGGVDGYLKYECIHTQGCNPYPSPIIPGYTVSK